MANPNFVEGSTVGLVELIVGDEGGIEDRILGKVSGGTDFIHGEGTIPDAYLVDDTFVGTRTTISIFADKESRIEGFGVVMAVVNHGRDAIEIQRCIVGSNNKGNMIPFARGNEEA